MIKKNFIFVNALLALTLCLSSCSNTKTKKDEDSTPAVTTTNKLSAALATVGVSSPTVDTNESALFLKSKVKALATTDVLLTSEAQEELIVEQSEKSGSTCFEGVDLNMAFTETQLGCYGPNAQLSATPSTNYPAESGETMSTAIPKGDFGIYKSAESGEACVAAKMNMLVKDSSKSILMSERLFAAILCEANWGSKELPAAGSSTSLTSLLANKLTGVTFTSANLSRAATDSSDETTYTMALAGTISSKSFSFTTVTTKNATTEESKGKIYGYLPDSSGQNSSFIGFSLVYNNGPSSVKLELKSAVASSLTGLFNSSTNLVDFTTATANNLYYILSDLDPATNLGKMYMAWQAGGGDSHTRVFRASTSNNGTADVGFGYFGYGDKINQTGAEAGKIKGMICNWVATSQALNTHATYFKSNLVQSQKIQRDSTTGYFTSTEDKINYVPTYTCDNKKVDNTAGGNWSMTILSCPNNATTCSPNEQVASTAAEDKKTFTATSVNDLATLGSTNYSDVGAITAPL